MSGGEWACQSELARAAVLSHEHHFVLTRCNLSFQESLALCFWIPRGKGTWITQSMLYRNLETDPFFFLFFITTLFRKRSGIAGHFGKTGHSVRRNWVGGLEVSDLGLEHPTM